MEFRGSPLLPILGRMLGAGAGAGIALLWVWFVFLGGSRFAEAGPPAWLAVAVFGGLGLAAVGAALRQTPLVLGIVGLISLFPVGLYMLMAPGFARWIGVLDLALILAAWMLWQSEDFRGEPPEG